MTDEKFELDYLSKFNSFFNTAKFSSTYKLVFLKSIMDISEFDNNNEESVIGHKWIQQEGKILQVDLNFIAVRYAKYYWDMYYKFRLRQSQHPDDVTIHQFFIKDDEPLRPPEKSDLASEEYDKLRTEIISSSIRPQVLKYLISEIDFYKRIPYKPYIEFDSKIIAFLKKFRGILVPAINYALTRYLEKNNSSLQIAEKVSGEVPRDYLTSKEKQYLMKFHKECFYCKDEFDKYHIDHVIPFGYVFHTDLFNCVPACETCNSSKSNKLPERSFFNDVITRNQKMKTNSNYTKEWYLKLYDDCVFEYHRKREFFDPRVRTGT